MAPGPACATGQTQKCVLVTFIPSRVGSGLMALATAAATAAAANAGELREVPLDTPGLLKVVRPLGGGGAMGTNYYVPTQEQITVSHMNSPKVEKSLRPSAHEVIGVGRPFSMIYIRFGAPVLITKVEGRFNQSYDDDLARTNSPAAAEGYKVYMTSSPEVMLSSDAPLIQIIPRYEVPGRVAAVNFSTETMKVVGNEGSPDSLNWVLKQSLDDGTFDWHISAKIEDQRFVSEDGNVAAGISAVLTWQNALIPMSSEPLPVQGAPEANNEGWVGFGGVFTLADTCVSEGLLPAYHLPLSVTATVLEQVTIAVNPEPVPVATGLKALEEGRFEITFSPATSVDAKGPPAGIAVRGSSEWLNWKEVPVLSGKTNSVVFSAKAPDGSIPEKSFYQLIRK